MTGFALFRMPYARECMLLSGEVSQVPSFARLGAHQGFVVAPFAPSQDEPVLVIQAEHVSYVSAQDALLPDYRYGEPLPLNNSDNRANYHIDFLNFHTHLLNGDFQKLVLSRSIELPRTDDAQPLDLFRRACERYPRMFVALSYTEQSGLWLAATPEVLLAESDQQWQTVALAGTMGWAENLEWSEKNVQEQRYVATYIAEQLELFTSSFTEDGPYTVRAGHLAHLRSDFHFTLSDPQRIGSLIETLHPTPAVCGLPKREAFQFILHNELHARSYYSGFMGPLDVQGRTHLFVTLRCMSIHENGYRLYAGGGLLTDSDEEQEWQETETKLDTMRRILLKTE